MTTETAVAPGPGTYADVNGLHMYYETHGSGRPLILLHGGLGSGEMFGPVLPALATNHQVIAVDLQGHGRTADIDRPLRAALMADDIAALIEHLGLDKPDLVGYSLGGGVALHTAFKYPQLVRKVVSASAHIRFNALYEEMLGIQAQMGAHVADALKGTQMHELYMRVAPRPEDFPRLLDKIAVGLKTPFDFTEEVRGLKVPTMFVAADADMAPPRHYVDVFDLLGGGQRDGGWMGEGRPGGGHALAILPGLTHYNLGMSPLFAMVTLAFLDEEKA
jgi:pimeloyl-ACP methyl ester carboxylesterase